MLQIVGNWRSDILAQYESALGCDVGGRVLITRDKGPLRQFAVEPAHPRLCVHVTALRNIRYLREAFSIERRRMHEMINYRYQQLQLHPPVPHLDQSPFNRRCAEKRRIRVTLL